MKRNAIIPLVLGLAVGLLAVKFGADAIRRAQASHQARAPVSIVRAKLDIGRHEEIRADMVELIQTEESVLIPATDRIEKLENATGRVTAKAIPKNSPVLLSMLTPPGTEPGIIGQIPPGYRAVSVKIDEVTGVAYQLTVGAWVDVTVVMDIDTGSRGPRGNQKETVAEVILQRVQVAAIGYGGSSTEAEASSTKVKPAKSVTLFVKEEDVPKLHLAQTKGEITLSMRGDEDADVAAPAIAYGREIMTSNQVPAVAAPAPPPEPVARQDFTAPVIPEPLPPHDVLVFHRSTTIAEDSTVEQVVFENVGSTKVLGIALGAPSRAAATMRALNENESRSSGLMQGSKKGNAASLKPQSDEDAKNPPADAGQ